MELYSTPLPVISMVLFDHAKGAGGQGKHYIDLKKLLAVQIFAGILEKPNGEVLIAISKYLLQF